MRTALLALSATALLTLSACGSSTSSDEPAAAPTTSASSPHDDMSMPGMDMGTETPDADAAKSTVDDATSYAVALEQVFFSEGYPKDLAGAKAAAAKLTDLQLAPGNSFGSYVFDSHDSEFRLCVENTSGAWSTYDTRPMSTFKSGASGGCP